MSCSFTNPSLASEGLVSFCLACGGDQVPHARDCQRRPVQRAELERMVDARIEAILKENHGISENPEPDTQRSGDEYTIGPITEYLWPRFSEPARHDPYNPGEPRPNASAAEPGGAPPAGAVPAGCEPGRAEGPGGCSGGADPSGDREPAAEE